MVESIIMILPPLKLYMKYFWKVWIAEFVLSGCMGEDDMKQDIEKKTKICGSVQIHVQFSSVQFSHSVVSDTLRPHESQHARPPCPSPTPRVHSNSHPSSRWCHPGISSSVIPFSSCPQSLPASEYPSEIYTFIQITVYCCFKNLIVRSLSIISNNKILTLVYNEINKSTKCLNID